jgi:hypothetical protein
MKLEKGAEEKWIFPSVHGRSFKGSIDFLFAFWNFEYICKLIDVSGTFVEGLV